MLLIRLSNSLEIIKAESYSYELKVAQSELDILDKLRLQILFSLAIIRENDRMLHCNFLKTIKPFARC